MNTEETIHTRPVELNVLIAVDKAAVLAASVAAFEELEASLVATVEQLEVELVDAERRFVREHPESRPYAKLNAEPHQVRAKLDRAKAELEGVRRELPIRREEAEAIEAEERAEAVRTQMAGLAEFGPRYEALKDQVDAWYLDGLKFFVREWAPFLADLEQFTADTWLTARAAGIEAEWNERLNEDSPLSLDEFARFPKDVRDMFLASSKRFHVRTLTSGLDDVGDAVRARPGIVRPETIVDPGPVIEPREPTEYVFVRGDDWIKAPPGELPPDGWERIEKTKLGSTQAERAQATREREQAAQQQVEQARRLSASAGTKARR